MKRLWLVPLVFLVALAYALLDDRSGLRTADRLRGELESAEARIAGLRDENARLREEARALREDPFARERALREELDLARPGEVLVRMPPRADGTPRIP